MNDSGLRAAGPELLFVVVLSLLLIAAVVWLRKGKP